MPKIPITIIKEADPTKWGTLGTLLSLVFVLGIFSGALISQLPLFKSFESSTRNLASVGDALVPPSNSLPTNNDGLGRTSLLSPLSVREVESIESDLAQTTEERVDENSVSDSLQEPILEFRVKETLNFEERETAILRLSREIARIKNSSVELISEFNQNCGVWTAECAVPYSGLLEKNNIAYNIAARDLDALTGVQ